MNRKSKIVAVVTGAVLALTLTGCGLTDGKNYSGEGVYEFTMTLDDGSVVPCAKVGDLYGYTCNWDKATRPGTIPTP